MEPTADSRTRTLSAHARLNDLYGEQAVYGRADPMHELVGTILSHRTTHANEVTAYRTMRERYPTWEAVRDAPLADLIDAIKTANYPEVKAPYIQNLLTQLIGETGAANIDFLADLSTEDAMSWLTNLPGIGLKTATLVLLFNFKKPVLPVDTHVHRVTQRLGLIGPKVSAEKAHTILLSYLPQDATVLFNFHKHFYWHGQRVCTWYYPKCNECVLRDQCDFYRLGGKMVLSSTPVRSKSVK
ncbi:MULTISPECIES: endonuclease III domain-containing protein [Spirosoma]|uniref:Endonuclease III n=1 Tax=Spirosoma liriopis TaxID=2937440 RepID=A0ABT0HFE9_9BACT|nr:MULTISPECIES: endonuclease III [Spirosoma]MCK8490875.1 endonuclease III [Spirosoma liriopis]UHG90260.1 endonuclease III [Spirosoma oryzicola]